MNLITNEYYVIKNIVIDTIIIAGGFLADDNLILRCLCAAIFAISLGAATALIMKTSNFFNEVILNDAFTHQQNQLNVWILMGIHAIGLIGFIFLNPILMIATAIYFIADLVALIYILVILIKYDAE